MTIVLEIAVGYVLGRFAAHLLSIVGGIVLKRALEKSPTYRRWVREDIARDRRLKREVGPGDAMATLAASRRFG
jgi:hypothetical protein